MVRFSSYCAILFVLLPFVIICKLGICELNASCNEKDKQILLCFKHGLTDPSGMLSTWSTKEDCCEWRGVQCDPNGRVKTLSLPCFTDDFIYGINKNKSHCLTGEFHLSLLELEFLKYLNLSNNNFKSVHVSFDHQNFTHGSGNSSSLVYLDLAENEILVIDDLRWLVPLSSLEYLDLSFIDLHKQTQWLQIFTMLPSLSELFLESCLLQSASPSLNYANFTSLEYLDLSDNDFFCELPNWLFNLSSLYHINLRQNRFQGQIPITFLNLKKLQFLSLEHNILSGTMPDWLGEIGSLKYLYLSSNLFTGHIPITWGSLSSLTELDVDSNHLNGSLPESFGKLSNLEWLSVGQNSLSGVVSPKIFASLSKLQHLSLGSPHFIFDFSPQWVPLFQLKVLYLQYVDLKLIPWLYTQKSLQALQVDHSAFTLESPNKFWIWAASLRYLNLYNNSINWDMSNVLLNSEAIYMNANGLTGGLPQLTSNVRILQIKENNFSGTLSPLLCHKIKGGNNLQFLGISHNSLSGGLTNCWENWKSLIHVCLGSNNLTGMIPYSMGSLSNLFSLNLNNNKLDGEIPLSLKNCQKLMIINLGENKFFGNIPNWMGQNAKALRMRSNEFSGDIPQQICQFSSMIVLDLANNRLSGKIPDCLNNITAMVFSNASKGDDNFGIIVEYGKYIFTFPMVAKGIDLWYTTYMHVIDLSSNHLSGKIPLELFKLTGLQSLNLSQNQLSGTIVAEIGNLKQLESLDFSNNKLSGEIPLSMSTLSFLGDLNLSFNNFWGQIPLGTQLQGFTALSYMGNPELCGSPLKKNCTHDEAPNGTNLMENDEEESELLEWFYAGMGIGFAFSFWIVCGSLFFIRTWRHAYFKFLNDRCVKKFLTLHFFA